MQDVHANLNKGLPWQLLHSGRRLFTSKSGLRKKLITCCILSTAVYGAQTGHLGN